MHDIRETEELVKMRLNGLRPVETRSAEDRTLGAALAALRNARPRPEPVTLAICRSLMKAPAARVAALALAALVVVIAMRQSQPVWAVEKSAAAVQQYRGCNLTVVIGSVVYDLWAKAEPSGELSGDLIMKANNGSVIWVKDNKTYYYAIGQSTIEVDDAKTAGFQPWLGPKLFRLLAKADDARTEYAKDPATGRNLAVMTGSLLGSSGHTSWSMEFDRETKLPVALKQWQNPSRSGPPAISVLRVFYYRQLPKDALKVDVPAAATYRNRPITLPDEVLERMNVPDQGMPTDGMTHAEAARKILERTYNAIIAGDLATIRKLCPLTASWGDAMLRALLLNAGDEGEKPARIVEIGNPVREESNRTGPFVVTPVRVKTRNGKLQEQKMIVQFRSSAGQESCAVYGPYGMTAEVK